MKWLCKRLLNFYTYYVKEESCLVRQPCASVWILSPGEKYESKTCFCVTVINLLLDNAALKTQCSDLGV